MEGHMPQPHLSIKISPAGTVDIEAFNCTGEQCVDASQPIEIVLGGNQKREDKPERFATPQSTEQAIRQNF